MRSLDVLTFEQSVESSLLHRRGTFLLTKASGAKRKHLCATRVGVGDVFIRARRGWGASFCFITQISGSSRGRKQNWNVPFGALFRFFCLWFCCQNDSLCRETDGRRLGPEGGVWAHRPFLSLVNSNPAWISWLKRPLLGALPAGRGLGDGPREGLLCWEGELPRPHQGWWWVHCRGLKLRSSPGRGKLGLDKSTLGVNSPKLNAGSKCGC